MKERPRVSLAALMGGVAALALSLGFGMPLVRSVVPFGPEITRLVVLKLGLFVLNVQIFYWCVFIPLIHWLRTRR